MEVTNIYENICLANKSKRIKDSQFELIIDENKVIDKSEKLGEIINNNPPNIKESPIIFCFAMFQSLYDYDNCNQYNIDFGQGFRDYQKIKRLIELGYTVYTIDDKHDSISELHCKTNFNN